MLKELLRRFTASYSEEEYKEWLFERPTTEDEFSSWCARKPEGIDSMVADAQTGFNRNQTEVLNKFGNLNEYGMKDFSCALADVANDTGYNFEFLLDMFGEMVADGETFRDAFAHVAGVSYEYDW